MNGIKYTMLNSKSTLLSKFKLEIVLRNDASLNSESQPELKKPQLITLLIELDSSKTKAMYHSTRKENSLISLVLFQEANKS